MQLFPNPLVTNPNVLTDVEMEGGSNFFFEVVSENCDAQGIAHVGFPQYSSLPVTGLAAYGSCSVTIIDQGDPSYQPAVLTVINTPAAGR